MLKYLFLLLAYLVGSIPFSYLLGKHIKKDDIRKRGSGNLGTTNAFRVFGVLIGISVLILDTLKSGMFIPIVNSLSETNEMFPSLIYGAVAVIGHIFPVWMNFKGGKGVASSFGILLFFYPLIPLLLTPVFVITRLLQFWVINYHYSPRKYNITLQSNMWVSSLEIEKKPIFFSIREP